MAFRVLLTAPAIQDVDEAANFIRAESPITARQWLADFWWVVDSLKEFPLRNAVIPEAEAIGIPYRSFPIHPHRLIYRVDEELATVYVVRLYHGARRPLRPEYV